MQTFGQYLLLKEAMQKSDVIDLFIVMSMPSSEDPAIQYVINRVIRSARFRIIKEIENIVIRELGHLDECDVYHTLRVYYTRNELLMSEMPIATAMDHAYKTFNLDLEEMPAEELYKKIQSGYEYLQETYISPEGEYTENETDFKNLSNKSGLEWNFFTAQTIFNTWKWNLSYGGPSWGKIAAMGGTLKEININKFLTAFERFVDFVHNTGPVLTKFKGYRDNWLTFILDFKQHTPNIRELIPYASYDVQKLFRTPAWRVGLYHTPGKGSSESFEGYKKLIIKYITDVIRERKFEDVFPDKTDEESILYLFNNMISEIGSQNFIDSFLEAIKEQNFGPFQLRYFFKYIMRAINRSTEVTVDNDKMHDIFSKILTKAGYSEFIS